MLIQFTVGNYKSFKDDVTFSLVASSLTSKDKTIDENNVFSVDGKLNLLKTAAIYGANASGKSNLVHAIRFMRNFVLNSSRETQAKDPIAVEPFLLSTKTENAPSFFEIVFLLEGKKYRYGFEVDSQRVHSEWLFYTPTRKEVKLFTREKDKFSVSVSFKEGKDIDKRTRENALFLSVVAQFNGKLAEQTLFFFRMLQVMSGITDEDYRYDTELRLTQKSNTTKKEIVSFVKMMDVGIENIQVETLPYIESKKFKEMPNDYRGYFSNKFKDLEEVLIKTVHNKFDSKKKQISTTEFDIDENESEGTKKIVALACTFLDTLKYGLCIIIDELDARLHPLITQSIIKLFNSNETNPNNAQLIFTTHDTNLLSNKLFRRDQVWFTEKNKYGATDLYSLAEYKIRNDASYEKDYIAGKYGAIPFIGNLSFSENPTDGKKTKTLG